MALVYRFEPPDRFVVGSIGDPPQRTYCLQAREGNRIVTMAVDEVQVQVLADHLNRALEEVQGLAAGLLEVPPPLLRPRDVAPLDLPLDTDFTVGTMAIGWDARLQALRVELFAESDEAPTAPEPGMTGEELAAREAARVTELSTITLDPTTAREFIARARLVLAAGRPACPHCLQPLDPAGHVCPRLNGYRGPGSWPVTSR